MDILPVSGFVYCNIYSFRNVYKYIDRRKIPSSGIIQEVNRKIMENMRLLSGSHSNQTPGANVSQPSCEEISARSKGQDPILSEIAAYEWVLELSHELRTPLNVILSAIQVTQLNKKLFDGEYRQIKDKHLSIMKQNCLRLMKIVNNLVDISRIDSEFFRINERNEDIVKIIRDITLSVSEYARMKDIHISFDSNNEEYIIACDAFLLERILLNLLSNALKYTPKGGSISIRLNIIPDKVSVTVTDTGSGIPLKYQNSIFNRFSQTDGASLLERKGSGLGLYLVKKLLEKMGGDIELFSIEGQGSTFTFFLPSKSLEDSVQKPKTIDYEGNRVETLQIEFSDIYI